MFLSQKSPIFPHFHDSPPKNRGLFRESLDDDLQLRREEILQTRGLPDSPFASDAELHVVTVSLHDVSDDKIRHSLLRVPTAFTVEAQDVNDLLEAGSEAVRNSVSMKKLMQSLERLD